MMTKMVTVPIKPLKPQQILIVETLLSEPKHTYLSQQMYPGQMGQSFEAVPSFLALVLIRGNR